MRWLVTGVGLMLSLGTLARPLAAQGAAWVGAGAGIAMPAGTLRDEANPGWRALAALELGLPDLPASLRIDAAYDRFGFKSAPAGSTGRETGARTIASASLSLAFGPSDSLARVAPYAVAGVGMNRVGCAGRSDCGAGTQMGWSAGLGMRFPLFGRRGFADARLHCVVQQLSDVCYVPVTVGLILWARNASEVDRASDDR
jgi:hypothetical protein